MTNEEAINVANMYRSMGLIYSREISAQASILFAEILREYNYQDIEKAMRKWLINEKTIPTPAQIIKNISNELSDDDNAELIAQSICACISTCGYTNPTRAKEQIGEFGYDYIVDAYGSWEAFCKNIDTNESLNIIRSQLPKRLNVFRKRSGKKLLANELKKLNIEL